MTLLTVPNQTLSDPADKTEVQENFTAVETVINGGLDDSNFAASGGLQTSKLAARHYEFVVTLTIQALYDGANINPPAASDTRPRAVVAIPGTTSDGAAYTVVSGAWFVDGAGTAGTLSFKVELGRNTAGAWLETGSDIVAQTDITGGTEIQSGTCTINTSSITLEASNQLFLGLFLIGTVDASALDAFSEYLTVTLKLKRTDGLRT